jgi:hypothetical protein
VLSAKDSILKEIEMAKVNAKKVFIDEMTRLVGAPDRFGHFKFNGTGGFSKYSYRIKVGGISWRLERKIEDGRWVKSAGAYFSAADSLSLATTEFIKRAK